MAFVVLAFLVLAGALLLPGEALAWGPGVHTAATRFVLANLDLFPASLAALLAAHPRAFLYGALSADFFVGKGTRARAGHSHNWEAALRLSRQARTPVQAAHAQGYLTHLAADVVAHNVYVPGVCGLMNGPANLRHVYVEMQADSRLTGGHAPGRKPSGPTQRMLDRCLTTALDKNPIATMCRKRMFRGSVRLSGLPGWDRSLRFARRMLPLPAGLASPEDMFTLSLRAVREVLLNPQGSPLLDMDPIGSANLARARRHQPLEVDSRLLDLPSLPHSAFQDVA